MTFPELKLAAALVCAGATVAMLYPVPPARAAEPPPDETTASAEVSSDETPSDETPSDETPSDETASDEIVPDPDPRPTVRDEIVVSAHFAPTERADVGSSVTVLERDDIERHRWPTVADALRTVPGTTLARSGGPGQVTSLFVRGGSSSQTLVLIDGLRVNSATTGAVDFADLLTEGVERIEVLRGPQSTLYGSEAAAGVVSILTRRAGSPGVRGSALAEAGEDDHQRLHVGASASGRRLDAALSGSWLDTDGVSAADVRRGNTETDRHENLTLAGRLGSWLGDGGRAGDLADRSRIDLSLRHIDGDVEVDGFSFVDGPVDDLDATNARAATFASLQATLPISRRWSQSLRFGWADDEQSGSDPTDAFSNFVVDSRRVEAESRAELALGDHVTSLGASFERREGASVGSFEDEVDIVAVYAEDRWALGDDVSLSLGVRRDDHDQFGAETTWRVATAWRAGAGGRLHASWGTGFKAPTFNDLYFPGFGNPELRPETTEAFDVGYEQTLADDRLRLDVTYFDIDFDDLIAFDFVTFLPQNIAAGSSRGVEASAAWRGRRVDVRAAYTWNETEDAATGAQLARRPEHAATLDVGVRFGDRLRLAAAAWASHDRIDSDGSELEDLERLDLTVHWQALQAPRGTRGPGLEPYVRLLNVFDDVASEVGGFGSRGRTAILGVSASWGG